MTVRHQKEIEFLSHIQENESVASYEAKFTELAYFAPHIVADEPTRTRKFLHGLRSGISSKLVPLLLTQYSDIVKRALVVEQYTKDFRKTLEGKKRPRPFEGYKERNVGRNLQKNQPRILGARPQLKQAKTTGCKFCGKHHPGKPC